jgi:glycosyltransferase involved in cell wall biosynthesis
MSTPMLSVVICTYNRGARLTAAVEALVEQRAGFDYEVLVVDNNSTDETPRVIRELVARYKNRVRRLFEGRQGLSHARNCGVAAARAPIVAFTDDDVRVTDSWVASIVASFEAHPDVDYVGGRVLPQWCEPPPAWLTTAHWSPLALQDYGLEPFVTGRSRAICLVGANLAVRREVFARIGGFASELGRVKDGIGSTEDHDFQLRMWRAGMQGLYDASITAEAEVTRDRMTKSYHRRWHRGHGRYCAAMRLRELVPMDMGPMSEPDDIISLFGSPAFVYRDFAYFAGRWARAVVKREDSFFYANKLRHIRSYLSARRAGFPFTLPVVTKELKAFAGAYRHKRSMKHLANSA